MTLKIKDPFVSVVTPVYNGEKYIRECVESVLNQTYNNFEYVIVNNVSTDKTPDIIEEYAINDKRIRIVNNKKHLERMDNVNHAMRQISGKSKYVKVVHADDWLFPECLQKMVAVAVKYPSIGIVGAYRLEEDKVSLDGLPYTKEFYNGRELGRLQILKNGIDVFGSPTSLLLDAEVVRGRDPFYKGSDLYADTAACYEILQEHDFGFVHQVLTFTRRHNESATSTFSLRYDLSKFAGFKHLVTYGPLFLEEEEYNKLVRQGRWNYHRFIAQKIFEHKNSGYFKFHFNELKKIRNPLNYLLLIIAMIYESLNVRETARRIMKINQN